MSEIIFESSAGLGVAAGLENRRGLWLRLVQHDNGSWHLGVTAINGNERRAVDTTVPIDGFSLPQWFTVVDAAGQWDEAAQSALLAPVPKMLGAGIGLVERSIAELNRGWSRLERERAARDAGEL
ncbi:hypothetical protein [Cupriavidus taiwanensis]|uniref:Uncharacterized protein n=1 Tax=Cupriavidus taiwanensis TaxID=164546 RepID=A0A375BWK5_9BURK|nr:hypothetical protein CBM2587_A80013 [Cupriavidus taiwanensis]